MKARILMLTAVVLMFGTSCDDLSLINYDVDFVTAGLTIPATDNGDTTYTLMNTFDPATQLNEIGVDPAIIKEVKIKSVEITLKEPQGGNFDWAKSAFVRISADALPEVTIGEVLDVPDGLNVLTVDLPAEELKEYLQAAEFTLSLSATNDQIIPVDHIVEVKTVFTVNI